MLAFNVKPKRILSQESLVGAAALSVLQLHSVRDSVCHWSPSELSWPFVRRHWTPTLLQWTLSHSWQKMPQRWGGGVLPIALLCRASNHFVFCWINTVTTPWHSESGICAHRQVQITSIWHWHSLTFVLCWFSTWSGVSLACPDPSLRINDSGQWEHRKLGS